MILLAWSNVTPEGDPLPLQAQAVAVSSDAGDAIILSDLNMQVLRFVEKEHSRSGQETKITQSSTEDDLAKVLIINESGTAETAFQLDGNMLKGLMGKKIPSQDVISLISKIRSILSQPGRYSSTNDRQVLELAKLLRLLRELDRDLTEENKN